MIFSRFYICLITLSQPLRLTAPINERPWFVNNRAKRQTHLVSEYGMSWVYTAKGLGYADDARKAYEAFFLQNQPQNVEKLYGFLQCEEGLGVRPDNLSTTVAFKEGLGIYGPWWYHIQEYGGRLEKEELDEIRITNKFTADFLFPFKWNEESNCPVFPFDQKFEPGKIGFNGKAICIKGTFKGKPVFFSLLKTKEHQDIALEQSRNPSYDLCCDPDYRNKHRTHVTFPIINKKNVLWRRFSNRYTHQ